MARAKPSGALRKTIKDALITLGIWFGIYAATIAYTFAQTVLDCGTDRSCEAGYLLMGALSVAAFGSLLVLVVSLIVRLRTEANGEASKASK